MKKSFLEFVKHKEVLTQFNESFKESDMEHVIELITSSLNKHCTKKIIPIVGYEDVRVEGTECKSKYFMIIDKKKPLNTKLFAINWNKTKNSREAYSIDFFNEMSDFFTGTSTKTALTIYTLGNSIVYFLPIIWTLINNDNFNISSDEAIKIGRENIDNVNDAIMAKESREYWVGKLKYGIYENLTQKQVSELFDINEARGSKFPDSEAKQVLDKTRSDAKDAETQYGPKSPEAKKKWAEFRQIYKALEKGATTVDDLKMMIKSNVNVSYDLDPTTLEAEEKMKEEREDPELVFKKMEQYIKMVIKGVVPSVIICGAAGLGKTYRTKRILKAFGYREGDNLYTIRGKCSERQLYLRLYEYRKKGEIVLIDDADSLVGPKATENTINILKSALDSTADDEGRLVSYGISTPLYDDDGNTIPKRMYYNGGAIILTNWNVGSLDTALRSRSFVQDIHFTLEEVLLIIKRLMPEMRPDILSSESKIKAYEYIEQLAANKAPIKISIRSFEICARIFEAVKDEPDDEFVESMIREQMKNQALSGGKKY